MSNCPTVFGQNLVQLAQPTSLAVDVSGLPSPRAASFNTWATCASSPAPWPSAAGPRPGSAKQGRGGWKWRWLIKKIAGLLPKILKNIGLLTINDTKMLSIYVVLLFPECRSDPKQLVLALLRLASLMGPRWVHHQPLGLVSSVGSMSRHTE